MIADLATEATYIVCRAQQDQADIYVDLMTSVDSKPIESTVGGDARVGFRAGCQVLRGKKIFLSVQRQGANRAIIRGYYRRVEAPAFVTGYRWNTSRQPGAEFSNLLPVLSTPRSALVRICFFSVVTDPNDNSTDFRRSRRVLVSPGQYLEFAVVNGHGPQATFVPSTCVDLEYPTVIVDVDWAVEDVDNMSGGIYLSSMPAITTP